MVVAAEAGAASAGAATPCLSVGVPLWTGLMAGAAAAGAAVLRTKRWAMVATGFVPPVPMKIGPGGVLVTAAAFRGRMDLPEVAEAVEAD